MIVYSKFHMIQQKYNLSLPKVIALDELEQVVTDLWKPDDNNKNNSLIGWLLFTVCVADILGNIQGEPTITGWITYWIYTVLKPGEHENKYKILAIGIQIIVLLFFVLPSLLNSPWRIWMRLQLQSVLQPWTKLYRSLSLILSDNSTNSLQSIKSLINQDKNNFRSIAIDLLLFCALLWFLHNLVVPLHLDEQISSLFLLVGELLFTGSIVLWLKAIFVIKDRQSVIGFLSGCFVVFGLSIFVGSKAHYPLVNGEKFPTHLFIDFQLSQFYLFLFIIVIIWALSLPSFDVNSIVEPPYNPSKFLWYSFPRFHPKEFLLPPISIKISEAFDKISILCRQERCGNYEVFDKGDLIPLTTSWEFQMLNFKAIESFIGKQNIKFISKGDIFDCYGAFRCLSTEIVPSYSFDCHVVQQLLSFFKTEHNNIKKELSELLWIALAEYMGDSTTSVSKIREEYSEKIAEAEAAIAKVASSVTMANQSESIEFMLINISNRAELNTLNKSLKDLQDCWEEYRLKKDLAPKQVPVFFEKCLYEYFLKNLTGRGDAIENDLEQLLQSCGIQVGVELRFTLEADECDKMYHKIQNETTQKISQALVRLEERLNDLENRKLPIESQMIMQLINSPQIAMYLKNPQLQSGIYELIKILLPSRYNSISSSQNLHQIESRFTTELTLTPEVVNNLLNQFENNSDDQQLQAFLHQLAHTPTLSSKISINDEIIPEDNVKDLNPDSEPT